MINTDEDALICDLAETYGIYDYRLLPLSRVATFSVGLRSNSRIKLLISGAKTSDEIMLLACIADNLSLLRWFNTEDGRKGLNRPKSILQHLCENKAEDDTEVFASIEEYEKRRKELIHGD